MMNAHSTRRKAFSRSTQQRGVVLFFALIALVVMSLAAVALIRSVDTGTMIAGNLAFKQSSTTSGDAGAEAAMAWLRTQQTAMTLAGLKVYKDTTHTFNSDNVALGYYTNFHPITDLTDGTFNWNNSSALVGAADASGNTVRYVIERMCNLANVRPTTNNCLFSSPLLDKNGQEVPLPQDICSGAGCPSLGQSPELRVTAKIVGPKNSVSYIQTFVY
jgi:type IV pilus assembly protein PilX